VTLVRDRRIGAALAALAACVLHIQPSDARLRAEPEAVSQFIESARNGDLEAVRRTVEAQPEAVRWRIRADWAAPGESGATALLVAAANGERRIVEFLISSGASFVAEDDAGRTALHMAATAVVARRLIEAGADLAARDARGATPLHTARTGSVALVLVDRGAVVGERDFEGLTPLHYACDAGRTDVAEILLQHKANPNARPAPLDPLASRPPSPMMIAAARGHVLILEAMVDRGGEPSANFWEEAPLRAAVGAARAEAAAFLLARGAEPRIMSPSRSTLVHLAAESCTSGDTLKVLLDAGLSPRVADEHGTTPLHVAAEAGNFNAARLLIASGADPRARDVHGKTALDVASLPIERENPAMSTKRGVDDPATALLPLVHQAQREIGRKQIVDLLNAEAAESPQ